MNGAVRALVSVLVGIVGLAMGLAGLLATGLVAVQPPALDPAASPQDFEIALEITDAFLTARLNEGGGDQPIELRNARAVSRADGTVLITGQIAPGAAPPGGGGPPIGPPGGPPGTPPAGLPRPPINLPGNPPFALPGATPGATPGGGTAPAVPAEIVLRPGSQDGKVTAEVVSAQLGPLQLPAGLGRLIERPINDQLAGTLHGEPFRVTAVSTRDGALIVRARTEGR
jgi:hypothetical protein